MKKDVIYLAVEHVHVSFSLHPRICVRYEYKNV